jgi:hypothetical protein
LVFVGDDDSIAGAVGVPDPIEGREKGPKQRAQVIEDQAAGSMLLVNSAK